MRRPVRSDGRTRFLWLLPVVAALALLSLPAAASADPPPGTIVVGTTADDGSGTCSLRAAIASANNHDAEGNCTSGAPSGETTTIEVPSGAYNVTAGELEISSDVNIFGAGSNSTNSTKIEGFANGQRDLEISSGNVTIGGLTIEGGSTSNAGPEPHSGLGGGIYVDFGATLTLQDSTVTGNEADTAGGGILNDGSLTILRSTIENNSTGTGGEGGGIGNLLSLSVTNSTIMENQAQGDGGGLYLAGPTTLVNDTIANNEANIGAAGGRGGGIANNGATVQLTNTLLAGNKRDAPPDSPVTEDCFGGVTSLGGNLADDTSCTLGTGDLQNTDPQLGSVDTSGPTDVLPLTSGSPAIDAGNAMGCPQTDQRYIARPQGSSCDIGAYEFTTGPSDYYVSTADELGSALTSQALFEVPATIHIAAGHYDIGTLVGQLNFGSDPGGEVTLAGAGAAKTILDGDNTATDVIDIGGSALTTIKGVTVENATDTGINNGGLLELDDSVVQNNTDVGIQDNNQGLTVSGSTISGNGNAAAGVDTQFNGGIFSESGNFTVVNSTITGNDGSGIYQDGTPGLSLRNVTIADNPGVGLDLHSNGGTAVNTIIGANAGGDCTNVSITFDWTSEHNNLDKDDSCRFNDLSDWPEVDPQLGPLQNNGGPTPTMALLAGNGGEAIDHGDNASCPAVDQRGISRPQPAGGACDIGAFELAQAPESIAFESNRFGSSQIFAMRPDGSNVTQLTHDPSTVTDSLPSISPDGHTVVYQSTVGGVTQIWAINGDGSNPRRLTSQGSNQQPTFSPDGKKIAFDSDRNGTSQLFVMNADGSGQTQVMTVAGSVGGSSWSPDGSHIAFNDSATGAQQIYTVAVGTGTVTGPLTTDGGNTNPHWSPDGSQLLFVSNRCDVLGLAEPPTCGGGESVFLMNADGTNQHNLTRAPIFDADPAWSPNGAQIAFVRDLGGQNFNVFTANADGTNQVQLTFGTAPQRNSFPNWGTQLTGGLISGSVAPNGAQNANLTALGHEDWALWGFASNGTSTSLAPDVRKAGGSGISDLTNIVPAQAPLRGLGQTAGQGAEPFSFDWSNGSGPAAATGAFGGLQHDGQQVQATTNGDGFSFTVPADTSERTLTVFTSEHWGTGTLTATLSDGSAQPYTQTVVSPRSSSTPFQGNTPGVFTIRYAAASAGQQLTVKWVESADNCTDFHCDNAGIYAVALSGALSNLTVNVTPSSAGAGIDQVPISTIPNAWLSFFAGSTSSTPVGSTPVGSTPVGSTPVGSTPVGSTPVGSTPVGSTPVGSTGLLDFPVGSTPVGSTPVGSTALASLLLSQIPLCGDVPLPLANNAQTNSAQCQTDGATWAQVLAGTSLAGQPLNALTLANVVANSTAKTRLAALPLKDVSFATTLFKTVHWSSLLLGSTPLSALAGGFPAWCGTNGLIPEDGGSCANATPDTTVLQMDVADQLGSAPVGSTPVGSTLLSLPVGSTPVGSTPVGSTDVPASLLAKIPLSDIASRDLDLPRVVNCNGSFVCTGKTLGDAYHASAILPTATFFDIKGAMAANGITVNDVLVAIVGAAGFPWEQLSIQGLQPYSATKSTVHYTVSTDVDCSLASAFTITAALPAGFFPVDGSAQVVIGANPSASAGVPSVLGNDATQAQKLNAYSWTFNCPASATSTVRATLTFDAWVGLRLGTFKTHVTAAAAGSSISATGAPVTVHQNPEASDPSTATEIHPDTLVAGHIAFSGEQAFYKVNLGGLPRGTRIQASLNVPSGADLDLTMSAPAAPSFFSTPVGSTPVGSTPIEDSGVGFSSSGLALPPDTLQDVPVGSTPVGSTPVGSTPVGSTSANRGAGVNEAGGIITSGQSGFVTIGVSGYNGAASNQPYVLRVQETPPPALPNCPARTFKNGQPSTFAAGSLPSSLPASTKTLFIVDKQRLMAMYPATDVNNMLTALNTLAARSEVSGTVLFVDGDSGVRSAYSAWDSTPCDTTARNNVVRAINDVVASYRNSSTGLPNLHYIVLTGSDEATPMADAPDPVSLSPEENEAADLAFTTNGLTQGNALYASAAQNYILTDGAYGAFTNIPWLGRSLLLPQLSVSRLVETPGDITGQINRYLGNNGISAPQTAAGTLNSTSALVTGYDFLADGAQSVENNLKSNFSGLSTPFDVFRPGVPAINNPGADWKPSTAYAAGAIVQPTSRNLSGLTFQAQNSGTSGVLEPTWATSLVDISSDNGITWKPIVAPWNANDVFSSALQATSPSSIVSIDGHYNHYELESASGDLANTGQATANLAARILFTMGCHGGLNVSDTLSGVTAPGGKYSDWPQLYGSDQAAMYIANTGYGYGDTASVALSERLLALFAKNLHSDSGSVGEEWVNALQQYFATAGAYDVYDEKVMEETTFYGLPFWHFSTAGSSLPFTPLQTVADPMAGGTQSATITNFPSGATTQSQFGLYRPNLPITSQQVTSSLPARGVWIKDLSSTEINPATAVIGHPTIDLAAHEPTPNVAPIFFPASPFTLEHSLAFGNERDYLNVSDQFRPTGPGNLGVQRHFTGGSFEILYSQSNDQLAPLISQVNVSDTNNMATVTARVTDDTGVVEVAALVNDGMWHYLQLTRSPQDPTLWTGTRSVNEDPEVFVEATDGVNVSYSANKGLNFTSTNSNTPPGGTQILLQAPVGPYSQGQVVNATYVCPAAAQCVGTVPSGSPIDTSTPGLHTFVVQAFDSDGNVIASLERQYSVDFNFGGFFQPVDNLPALNVAKAGSGIPVKFSLGGNQGLDVFYNSTYPASQQISCSTTAPLDTIETTVTAGGSSLSYDASSNQYTYVWKTSSSWSGTCRALVIRTKFGTFHTADFKFK